LTVTGGGTLAGAGLTSNGTNVYAIAAGTPAALTTTLDAINFVAPPLGGAASVTSTINLNVVDGQQTASVVSTGYTVAGLTYGRLTATFGTTPDTPGLPGSQYLNIHGN